MKEGQAHTSHSRRCFSIQTYNTLGLRGTLGSIAPSRVTHRGSPQQRAFQLDLPCNRTTQAPSLCPMRPRTQIPTCHPGLYSFDSMLRGKITVQSENHHPHHQRTPIFHVGVQATAPPENHRHQQHSPPHRTMGSGRVSHRHMFPSHNNQERNSKCPNSQPKPGTFKYSYRYRRNHFPGQPSPKFFSLLRNNRATSTYNKTLHRPSNTHKLRELGQTRYNQACNQPYFLGLMKHFPNKASNKE